MLAKHREDFINISPLSAVLNTGIEMSFWVYCNSCFLSAAADRQLAVTTCGHVICSVCYQKGKQKNCLICSSQCQISPLSDKSSSEVKTLFSDINVVTTKHLTEISKVISFQSRHQRKLLTHYKKRNEKLEETFVKMKQEMQKMAKKLNEQSVYIAKMEKSLQHQSAMAPPVSQMSRASYSAHVQKPALQIPYNSPAPLLRHFPATNIPTLFPDCQLTSPPRMDEWAPSPADRPAKTCRASTAANPPQSVAFREPL
ncbi:putative E3 SUMO-protein ligase RNF212 isoform X3 [Oryzias latipes]